MIKDTQNLIKGMTKELDSVAPASSVLTQFIMLMLITIAIITVWVALSDSPNAAWRNLDLLTNLYRSGIPALGGILAIIANLALSTPDIRLTKPAKVMACLVAIIWVGLSFNYTLKIQNISVQNLLEDSLHHWKCLPNIATMALFLAVGMFIFLKRKAPLEPKIIGILAAIYGFSFAIAGRMLVCSVDSPLQMLLTHYSPILPLSAIGLLVLGKFLRW